ncbi:Leukotriene-B4 omega-hydroxylase 3 [Microtus ochrogaster]|uniref:Leukotriene-B4 omega-hydroxylase 3 n=1 Tax=Microtus ochrogaster TaxID=79684 RepID=A0A8J6GJF7_MICOH|nr:Leukotriene-B4 omega-hydroxylase 3 [Microtus ochrogaster]
MWKSELLYEPTVCKCQNGVSGKAVADGQFQSEDACLGPSAVRVPTGALQQELRRQTFAMSKMKVALALTLLCFRVRTDNKELRRQAELILSVADGLCLRVEPLSSDT